MQVQLTLPNAAEAGWKLVDADGNVLASSDQNSEIQLIIDPYFYKGVYAQAVVYVQATGSTGRRNRQVVRVGGSNGKFSAETLSAPKKVKPKFDRPDKPAATDEKPNKESARGE